LHTNDDGHDGGNATHFLEIHHKSHYLRPLQHSPPLEEKLGEVSYIPYTHVFIISISISIFIDRVVTFAKDKNGE
jgi:hypothetical protein